MAKKKKFGTTLVKASAIGTALGAGLGKLMTKSVKSVNTNPYKKWRKK